MADDDGMPLGEASMIKQMNIALLLSLALTSMTTPVPTDR
jgi:hypothetical protein